MTQTERRQRITAVFEQAKKLRPEDQGRFLERECRGDRVLIEELKSLLSEYRERATWDAPPPASNPSAGSHLPPRIGRYEITGEIGSGGFGHVYSALDPAVDRVVAIKVLNAPGDAGLVKRFRAEAMTVANLHHKNIVTVHEFGEENGAPYLVMEFLEGTNVHDLIRQHAPLSLHEKLWIMSEVAEGLQCAHARGVIHRDVKPANIMRLSDGSVKIMDFGIARMAAETSTRLTQTGFVVGSLMYMAPEQFSGTADALSDIFAYGVTFYELLTGRHPFPSTDPGAIMYRIMNAEPEALRSLVPECPESIERIVNRTLAKNREARYSSLADVAADTRPILLDLQRQQAGELFSRADQLFANDQLDAAQSAVRKALELDPWHTEARRLRSAIEQALHRRDLVDRAGELLDRAEQELSQRKLQEATERLATVKQMSLGDARINARLEKAYSQIEQARNAQRLLDAAREGLQTENLTEAFRAVSEVLASDPGNGNGQQLLREIQTLMASREAQRRVQEEVSHVEGLLLIGETDQALALLAEIEKREPSQKELSALRARAAAQKAEEERARRLTEGIAAVKSLLKTSQFDDAVGRIDLLLGEFRGNRELTVLRRHATEQAAARKRTEAIRRLKAEAAAWIERGEYDSAIRALESGVATLGEDGDLTRLLQSAVAGKAVQERERAISRIAEDVHQFRRQGQFDDALRVIERAIQRWGNDPPLPQLHQEVSDERREQERRQRIRDVVRKANDLIHQKKADAAVTLLRQSIEQDGADPERQKLLDGAQAQVQDRSRSVLLNARREEVQGLIGGQRWEDAQQRLDECLREFPGEPSLVSQRESVLAAIASENRERAILKALAGIQSLCRESRLTEATELLEKSLGEYGGDARLLETRHILAENLAQHQRAEYFGSLRKKCLLLLKQGHFGDALRLLEGSEVRYPNSGEVADLFAEAKAAREAHEGEQSIQTALAQASELIQKGNSEAGISALEDALRSYPNSSDLTKALARARTQRDAADRQREIQRLTEAIERAVAEGEWGRAINRIAAGLDRFPGEASFIRLKRTAEEAKHRSEVAEVETSVLNALQGGNSTLAAEITAAARIRWPDEKKLHNLHQEVELSRADQGVAKAKQLLQSGRFEEAEQLAAAALKRWPRLASAADLLEEIAARKLARAKEEELTTGGPPDSPRRSWSRLAVWGAAAAMALGGVLYWVSRPSPKKTNEVTNIIVPETNDLKIAEPFNPSPAVVGTPYKQALQTSGGSLPISWAVAQGSLPPGLSLDRQAGRIEGTPGAHGTYTFVAQASDSRGHTAQSTLTVTVLEPYKDKTPATPIEKAQNKPLSQTSTAIKPSGPETVPPVPAPQTNVQEPCKAKPFILDQYGDSRSGELAWTGSLAAGGELEIRNRRASIGFIRGDILPPGVPVRVSVTPENVGIVAAPSANNCWDSRLVLKNSFSPATAITIKWVVYQP